MADDKATTAAYALLGLLAVRPWTGYELTQQAQRSLRFIWPTSAAHLYREQKRLVTMGWVTAESEVVGRRPRTRYAITRSGRAALRRWAETEPAEPAFEVEGVVRAFFGDMAGVAPLEASMRSTAAKARASLDDMLGFAEEYLAGGGPFPDRIHVIAIAIEAVTELLGAVEDVFSRTANEVARWETTVGRGLDVQTRRRLERVLERHQGD